MKPNFALTLSFEGIGVLHRAFPGWHLVGEVSLASPDFSEELASLREKALALDPSGLDTKLVIPNDQIRYLCFEAGDRGNREIAAAVREALNGATPYDVDELASDWSVGSGNVHVAAVARQTLAEAEGFALEHGFAPCCFVAIPEAGSFVGEPFFGVTDHATRTLAAGDHVDREAMPIRIVGTGKLPEVPPPPISAPDPLSERDGSLFRDRNTETARTGSPHDRESDPAMTEPGRATATDDTAARRSGAAPEQAVAAPKMSFSSIRAHRRGGPVPTPPLAGPGRITVLPEGPPEMTEPDSAPGEYDAEPADAEIPSGTAPRLAASLRPSDEDAREGDTPPVAGAVRDRAAGRGRTIAALFTSRRGQRSTPAHDPGPAQDEAERLTIFGARGQDARPDRPGLVGITFTALLLIFFVGIATWASIFLGDGPPRWFTGDPEAEVASTPENGSAPEPPGVKPVEPLDPVPEETAGADDAPDRGDPEIDVAALPADDPDTDTAAPDGSREDAPPPAAADPEPAEETAAQPESTTAAPEPPGDDRTSGEASASDVAARYAATGIWQLAPEAPRPSTTTRLEAFYKTSVDRALRQQDGVAKPEIAAMLPDTPPPTPLSPPPAGSWRETAEPELVEATEDGVVTQGGVRVFAGAPAVEPPQIPDRPEFVDGSVSGEEIETLASLRPRQRPEDIAPEQGEDIEEAEDAPRLIEGLELDTLRALRPRQRPASLVPAPQQEAQADAAEDQDGDTGAEPEPDPGPFNDVEPQAVSVSLTPIPRPEDLAEKAAELRSADVQRRETAAEQAVEPDIPSSATVAKQATERNALNLRKVNLIGIYGAAEDRRALVRLSNGRYRKVQVGDRLDGGQVAAIGEAELRYVKRGQSVILRMPRG